MKDTTAGSITSTAAKMLMSTDKSFTTLHESTSRGRLLKMVAINYRLSEVPTELLSFQPDSVIDTAFFVDSVLVSYSLTKLPSMTVKTNNLSFNFMDNRNAAIFEHLEGISKPTSTKSIILRTFTLFDGQSWQLTYSKECADFLLVSKTEVCELSAENIKEGCSLFFCKKLENISENAKKTLQKYLETTIVVGKFVNNDRLIEYKSSHIPCFVYEYGIDKSSRKIKDLNKIRNILNGLGCVEVPNKKIKLKYSESELVDEVIAMKHTIYESNKGTVFLVLSTDGSVLQAFKTYCLEYEMLKKIKECYFLDHIQSINMSDRRQSNLNLLIGDFKENYPPKLTEMYTNLIAKLDGSQTDSTEAIKEAIERMGTELIGVKGVPFVDVSATIDSALETNNDDFEKLVMQQSRNLEMMRDKSIKENSSNISFVVF